MSESEPDRNREPLFWSALLFAVIVLLDYWRSGEFLFSIAINALWAGALCVSLFFVGSCGKEKLKQNRIHRPGVARACKWMRG